MKPDSKKIFSLVRLLINAATMSCFTPPASESASFCTRKGLTALRTVLYTVGIQTALASHVARCLAIQPNVGEDTNVYTFSKLPTLIVASAMRNAEVELLYSLTWMYGREYKFHYRGWAIEVYLQDNPKLPDYISKKRIR